MKTEQEQRQAIRQILFDANDICQATPCENEYCIYHGDYRCYDNIIVDKLIKAGYGDISEYKNRFEVADKVLTETRAKLTKAEHDRDRYKAEIERLKANINQAQDQILSLAQQNQEYREQQVKQAKIDVLNELREKYSTFGNTFAGWIAFIPADDIDQMIEELKK